MSPHPASLMCPYVVNTYVPICGKKENRMYPVCGKIVCVRMWQNLCARMWLTLMCPYAANTYTSLFGKKENRMCPYDRLFYSIAKYSYELYTNFLKSMIKCKSIINNVLSD
jgi:hypothetical protein